jgi:hypothetical protein
VKDIPRVAPTGALLAVIACAIGCLGATNLLCLNDAQAVSPLTVDPIVEQGPGLTPSDATGSGEFG